MRRFRNPRYAPEFLERRLTPSSYTGLLAPALYATDSPPEPTYPPDPSLPPIIIPTPPTGPALPA
jgi:hypothetical protein